MSWNSFLFVKCISAFNYMWLIYNNTHNKCQNMYHYLKDYYYGYHDIWLFIPGHNFPLSLTNLNNNINVQWIYDNYDNTLMFITNDEHTDCKLSWLSAKIKLQKNTILMILLKNFLFIHLILHHHCIIYFYVGVHTQNIGLKWIVILNFI